MEFRLLGPIDVSEQGRDITPTAPKQRQVLALLLARANRRVSVPTLLNEVWGYEPPRTATTALQTYIGSLRKTFATATGTTARHIAEHRLVTDGNGYVLKLADTEWDRPRFERLVLQARGLMEEREAQRATEVLGEALAMWRGAPFCNVKAGSQLTTQSRVLNEAHLAACEVRVDALLSAGRFQEAVGDAVALVEEHPYHENVHAQLMRALYASGRRAAALEVYQSLRRRMSDDLGITPSPTTRTLHHAMLQDRPDQRYLSAAGAVR
ncbi:MULTISPECIES: AfsR/SARP family transcriptional regulator [unclassified Streptomyces]|uniref:AfsR/SARP family transcriptional regulator n=1 Tax=unclassified Streptomyces TaxID=2593676 RepID=UPI002E366E42|nr:MULTISPECIES: AfsR/SARP family transcriptional regulator [unclassified Streptomyces]WUB94921.1 AfsR/SARP family transcriptional regulator [Streptomyces sp. NBC_00569]